MAKKGAQSSLNKRWGPPSREELARERAINARRRERRAERKAKLAAMTPEERKAENRRREHRRLTLRLTRAVKKLAEMGEEEQEFLFERIGARTGEAADALELGREVVDQERRCAREGNRGAVEQEKEKESLCATAVGSGADEQEKEWMLRLDLTFGALASGARRRMLDVLYEEDGRTVAELARAVGLRHQSATKHVAVLEGAGLVEVERRGGRRRRFFLRGAGMQDLRWGWLGKF